MREAKAAVRRNAKAISSHSLLWLSCLSMSDGVAILGTKSLTLRSVHASKINISIQY